MEYDGGDGLDGLILWAAPGLEEDNGRVWKRVVWKRRVVVFGRR